MATTYHERLLEVLISNKSRIDNGVSELSNEIIDAGRQGRSVWVIGNGGSASTAEHFEIDLAFARHSGSSKLPLVISLTSNSAVVTAIANDISYDELFALLLKRRARKRDLLISISASGNSRNIVNAINQAQTQGLSTFSLLGFDGGQAEVISEKSLVVRTNLGEYGIVEDVHLSICHAVSAAIQVNFGT